METHPKVALVLGGGGSRGIAHVGVLEVLVREQIPDAYLQAVAVTNESRQFSQQAPFNTFSPCAILLQFGAQPLLPEIPNIDGFNYQRVWANNSYQIYVPMDAQP